MKPDSPEEDKFLRRCQHEWMDLYGGTGVDRHNLDKLWVYFYCKKCLVMRLKSCDQSMMRLNEGLEAERDAD